MPTTCKVLADCPQAIVSVCAISSVLIKQHRRTWSIACCQDLSSQSWLLHCTLLFVQYFISNSTCKDALPKGILSQDCGTYVHKGYFEQIRNVFDLVELESISKKKQKQKQKKNPTTQNSISAHLKSQ